MSGDAQLEANNMKAMREAVKLAMSVLCRNKADATYLAWCEYDDAIQECRAALAAPPRNCDLYGGDYKMLHTKWSEWTASPSGRNPNNTMKMTFSEWLLATANEKVAIDGAKKARRHDERRRTMQ